MPKAGRSLLALGYALIPAALVAAGIAVPDPRDPQPRVLRAAGAAVGALAESPAGGAAACGDAAGTLSLYDLKSAAPRWTVKKAHAGAIIALRFDGGTLYSLGEDGVLRAWDADGGGKALQASQPLTGSAGLWLSPDPRLIYSALPGGGLGAFKRQTLGAAKGLTLATASPCMALLPLKEGHLLASQADGWLCYADPVFGVVRKAQLGAPVLALAAIKVEAEEEYAVALLADGQALFVGLKDLSVKKTVALMGAAPAFAFVSHEAKRALLISADGRLNGYLLPSGSPEADAPGGAASAACLVDGGNGVLVGAADGSLRLWRQPGVQAAFAKALDKAEAAAKAGRFDEALPAFNAALQLFQDPVVRDELEQAKAAKLAALRAERDRMKAMMRR
jgi:WD40 repeat protein